MAFLMLAIVAVGFGPTLYLRSVFGTVDRLGGGTASLPPHLLVHGIVLTAWFLLLAVQTSLVVASRTALHRRLGVAGGVLAIAVVASSVVTIQRVLPRAAPLGEEAVFGVAAVVVSDFWVLVAFVLLVAAAVHFRRQPATHKRLMLLASVVLIGPAFSTFRPVGRALVPLLPSAIRPSLAFILFSVGAIVLYDLATRKRIEPATLWGTAVIAAALVLTFAMVLGGSGIAFARWFSDLAS
jgi:hypothetical protein